MIFTMDIGNTNIKTALFDGDKLLKYWRISTNRNYTSDEYGMVLTGLFSHDGYSPKDVEGIMISSVVPTINFTVEHMCKNYFSCNPLFVSADINLGIELKYERPRELGCDRIANAVAAYNEYGGPCIFIDFGTATTFGAIDDKGSFLGGCICPGIKLTSEAIVNGTAKLPRFELIKPDTVIGKNTVSNLQSGLIYGYIGQVKHLIYCMREELGFKNTKVVATGGMARILDENEKMIDIIDGLLTLKGLRILYEINS